MESDRLFDSIEPRTLRTAVVDSLRDAIVSGRLEPGQHLVESTLAEQMSVSRSPVREALGILEREGLVTSLPNRGSYVREFSAHDVDEIFSLRTAIESLAGEWAIELLDEDDFRAMERLLELQKEAAAARDMARLNVVDISFHEYICRRAGHSRVMEVWGGIRGQCLALFQCRLRAYPQYVPQTVVSDHGRFLEAFKARDLAQVLALHREVNQRVVREIKEVLARAAVRR